MDETLVRILNLMKEKKITAVSMEDFLEIPRGSFSNWKRGKGRSYYEHISKIADRLEESLDYLIRGRETDALEAQERELVIEFRKLPEEAKNVILKNVRLLIRH